MTELVINNLPTKRKNPSDKEREIIRRALLTYKVVLGQYKKYTDEMKQKDMEKLSKENNPSGLDTMNPFNVDVSEQKTYEPTLEDTKTFVYSSWAEAVANVQTPYICDGQRRKAIRKKAFRDIQHGKFINSKVVETMNNFVSDLYQGETNNN